MLGYPRAWNVCLFFLLPPITSGCPQYYFRRRKKHPDFFSKSLQFDTVFRHRIICEMSGCTDWSAITFGVHWDNLTKETNFKTTCKTLWAQSRQNSQILTLRFAIFWALNQVLQFMLQPSLCPLGCLAIIPPLMIFNVPSNPDCSRILILSHISCLFSRRLVSSSINLW